MRRALIAIGCNTYDHAPSLQGAEADARRVFEALTTGANASYSAADSRLLMSPTLDELQATLTELDPTSLDTLTFYFAGHGHVKAGTFHLCVRNTQIERTTSTAYPLHTLLAFLQEASPRQANVVIDACESGGVVADIGRALNPDVIGNSGSTGISLLAACARDQFAYETPEGGRCTSALVKCLDGTTFVQDITESLELTEVARNVATEVGDAGVQSPTYWGLNLTGQANFCRNPHFDQSSPLRGTLAKAKQVKLSQALQDELWATYQEIGKSWNPAQLRNVLIEASSQIPADSASTLQFFRHVSLSFLERGSGLEPFQKLELRATCLSPLLQYCHDSELIEKYVEGECKEIAREALAAASNLLDDLRGSDFALIQGGLSDLYFLPLRVIKVLGWIGASLTCLGTELTPKEAAVAKDLTHELLRLYPLSISSMSDAQAPSFVAGILGLRTIGMDDECETIAGLMFSSACEHPSHIAAESLDASQVLDFLMHRHSGENPPRGIAARPSQLIFAILRIGVALKLDDVMDPAMSDLDHTSINAFFPTSYLAYAQERMDDGTNATIEIGDGLWTLDELYSNWQKMPNPAPENDAVAMLAMYCSLLFPDRVYWPRDL